METKDYITRKNTKLNKDIVVMVGALPSFGYGETPDAMIKMAIMNYFLTLISATNVEEAIDVEILFQSVADEVNLLTRELIARVSKVKHQIESNT